nr:HAD family hydrolase [Paludisphaera mucosa]
MSWSFKFWNDRLRQDLSAERRRSLSETLPLPRLARLAVGDGEVLSPPERLRAGDQVLVGPGELVPTDGRVIQGSGVVDEQALRGLAGASRIRRGDVLLAGSRVLHGSLRLEVAGGADRTRASQIGRALLAATSHDAGASSPTRKTEAFAERAVAPTFAMAGVGLLAGDLATAAAILRPDYATGPGVALPLETVRDATACARIGVIVRSPDAFERVARADAVVIDDSPALRARGLEVVDVQSRLPESLLLRYAASAFRHMADERTEALLDACRTRRCHVLDLPAAAFDRGVTVVHDGRSVMVRGLDEGPTATGPLVVEIDGAAVGVVTFGPSPRPKAARAIERLRERPGVAVVLLSDRPEAEVGRTAASLGISTFLGGRTDVDKAAFLRDLHARGARTAFFGDGRLRGEPAAAADVAVSTSGEIDREGDPAEVVLMQPRLDLFADLCDIAGSHAERARTAQRLVILPNALCVVGALFFGATALAVVIVSNLSTLGLYQRSSGALHSAAGRERPRRRLVASPIGT